MIKSQIYLILGAVVAVAVIGGAAFVLLDDDSSDSGKSSGFEMSDEDKAYYSSGVQIENNGPQNIANGTTNNFTLTEKPHRIFVMFAGNVELLCYYGMQDYIVGGYVRSEGNVTLNADLQDEYDAVLADKSKGIEIGQSSTWSKEYIMSCNPDLIVGWSSSFSDTSVTGSLSFWNDLGVNCLRTNVYGNQSGASVETYFQLMEVMGKVFNKSDLANQQISTWKNNIGNIEAAVSQNVTDKKTVLVVDDGNYGTGNILLYGSSMITGNLLEYAGAVCAHDGRMDEWTYEETAVKYADVDMVFIVSLKNYTSLNDSQIQSVKDWWNGIGQFSSMKATVNNQIYVFPFYELYMSGILDDDVLVDMYNTMYPELKGTVLTDADYYSAGVEINNEIASTTTLNDFTLTQKPTRIFVVNPQNIELLCYFGLQDFIVGGYVSSSSVTALNDGLNDAVQYVLSNKNIMVAGSNAWSKEEVMACDPDMIIGWSSTFTDSYLGSIDYWNALGINCFRTNLYGNGEGSNIDTYYQMMDTMGKMFHESYVSDEMKSKWNGIISDIEKTVSDAGITEKKKVLVVDYGSYDNGQSLFVYGTNMLTGCLIEKAGGDCMSSGRMDKYTFEEIATDFGDADIVFVVGLKWGSVMTDDDVKTVTDWWASLKELSTIDATVVTLPFYHMYMGGMLNDDCLNEMFAKMYPELQK